MQALLRNFYYIRKTLLTISGFRIEKGANTSRIILRKNITKQAKPPQNNYLR